MNNNNSLYSWYRNTIRNPKYRWWIVLGTLVYVISPFDIAPDFIPIIGQIDDVLVLTILVSEVSQMVLDWVKSRKGQEVVADTNNSTETEKTVDVDSIPIQ